MFRRSKSVEQEVFGFACARIFGYGDFQSLDRHTHVGPKVIIGIRITDGSDFGGPRQTNIVTLWTGFA